MIYFVVYYIKNMVRRANKFSETPEFETKITIKWILKRYFLNSASNRKDSLHGIIMYYPSWTGLVIHRKWSLCLTPPAPNAGWFPELQAVTYIFGIIFEDNLDWINQLISHSADIPPPTNNFNRKHIIKLPAHQ